MEVAENRNGAEIRLKTECEQIWENIYEIYSRIQARKESCPPKGTDMIEESEKIHQLILHAKENKIKAEISALQSTEITAPSKESQPDERQMKIKLAERASQLEKTLLVVKNEKQEIEERLKREEELLLQHQQVQQSIQQKINEMEMEKENIHSTHSKVRTLETKRQRVEQNLSELVKQLGAFIKEHFPLPNVEDQKYTSLQQLLEDLIQKLFNSPHDPYITIMPCYWPPYIELLLRCGIALRHQQDSNLIKLESFQA